MKKIIIITILIALLSTNIAFASTIQEQYNSFLIQLIQKLTEKIAELQQQLDTLNATTTNIILLPDKLINTGTGLSSIDISSSTPVINIVQQPETIIQKDTCTLIGTYHEIQNNGWSVLLNGQPTSLPVTMYKLDGQSAGVAIWTDGYKLSSKTSVGYGTFKATVGNATCYATWGNQDLIDGYTTTSTLSTNLQY